MTRRPFPRGGIRTRLPVTIYRRASDEFSPTEIEGLALWLDASSSDSLFTTDAGPVVAVASPLDIAGCVGWWDSSDLSAMRQNSDGTGAVAAGDPVGWWLDKSATGATVTGSGSARPTLSATGFNGKQALVFNGSSTSLSRASYTATNSLSGMTRIAVCANTTNTLGLVSRVTAGGSDSFLQMNGGVRTYISSNGAFLSVPLSTNNSIAPAGVYVDVFSNSAISFYSSGAGLAGTVYSGPIAATTDGGTPAIYIGSNSGANFFWNGPIAEYIIFNRALTRAELASVEAYLAAKWGISGVHAPATASSDPVGYWGDKSGNGRHLTQATANLRGLVFTASGRTRVDIPATLNSGFSSATPTTSSTGTVIQAARFAGNPNWLTILRGDGSAFVDAASSGSGAATSDTAGTPSFFVQGSPVASTRGTLYSGLNDVNAVFTATNINFSTWSSGWRWYNFGSSFQFIGEVGEVLVYNRALTTTERQRAERYLAARWGITLAPQVANADAQNWIDRVYANGGTVSSATAGAVNSLCDSLDASGVRPLMYRMGIFAGSNLNAALVPLYRGPSLGGTQYGNATDTNVGPFVSGDYADATGLAGGSGKYLRTGLTQTSVGLACHLAFYDCAKPTNAYANRVGSRGAGDANEHQITNVDVATTMHYGSGPVAGNGRAISTGYTQAGAFWLGINPSATSAILYKNGVSAATASPPARTAQSVEYWLFALNNNGSIDSPMTTGRSGGYSIGLSMDATQAAAYNTAMQAFQTSLTRNA